MARMAVRLAIGAAAALGLVLIVARLVPSGWLLPVIVSPAANVNRMDLLDLDRMLLGPLRDVANPNFDPALSPDGRALLYSASLSTDTFGEGEVVLRDIATGDERRLTRDSFPDSSPTWAPDGHAAVFVSLRSFNTDLYLLDLVTGTAARLTDAALPDFDPAWSPDGRLVAYVSYDDEDDSDLFLLDPTCGGICGRKARQLIDEPGYDLRPVWSPDGRQLAFVSERDGDGFQIFLVEGDCLEESGSCGDAIRRLTDDFPIAGYDLVWTPGAGLVALVARGRTVEIYRIDPDCPQVQTGCPVAALGAIGRPFTSAPGP